MIEVKIVEFMLNNKYLFDINFSDLLNGTRSIMD